MCGFEAGDALYFCGMWKKQEAGFTILEILIVLAVFGLLVTLTGLSVRSARMRMRDAARVSDVSVLRSALGQYWLEKATYPVSSGVNLGQPGTNTDKFSAAGFVSKGDPGAPVYLSSVPTGPKPNEYYRYHGSGAGYSIRFVTESDTTFGKANVFYAHSTGVDGSDQEK